MRRMLPAVFVASTLALGVTLSAQLNFPEIPYDAVDPLTANLPQDTYLGEAAGVATNSKGEIFVYTRTGTPRVTTAGSRNVAHGGARLFQFDRTGKFIREMGQGAYGFLMAQQVRVDPQDNIWVVDQMANQVIKFDPNGRIQMIFGRKPEAINAPTNPLNTLADTYALVPRAPMPPAAAAGAGVGQSPTVGDVEIAAEEVLEGSLDGLRFGDLIAFRDLDSRVSRYFRPGRVTIGILSHGPSPTPGHGPGVTVLLTGPADLLHPTISPTATLAPALLARSIE